MSMLAHLCWMREKYAVMIFGFNVQKIWVPKVPGHNYRDHLEAIEEIFSTPLPLLVGSMT